MYLVVFNGPPFSGKDTVAEMLAKYMDSRITAPVRQSSLSWPLRVLAYAMTSFKGEYDGPDYAQFKETYFEQFGRNGRELMIDVSERFLKQCYGQPIMAQMFLARNANFPGVNLIRDGGFQVEVSTMIAALGPKNVYVVRMHREGCDFSNDSREYINHPNSSCQTDLWNNGSLADLRTEAGRIYGRLVNQMGWKL